VGETHLGGIPTDWRFDWRSAHWIEVVGISAKRSEEAEI
jgi:hypothetical protein